MQDRRITISHQDEAKQAKRRVFWYVVVPLTMGIHMILLSLFIIKNTPPGTQGDYELEVHGLSGKEFSKKYVKHRWIVGGEYCVQTNGESLWLLGMNGTKWSITYVNNNAIIVLFTCSFAYIVGQQGRMKQQLLVGGLEHFLWLSIYWECHHPNWRSHIFQRGRSTTNQSFACFFFKSE